MKTSRESNRRRSLTVEFVKSVPERLADGVLYVSVEFATAVHLCGCGCRNEVVTPLSRRTGWKLLFDGETVSLTPSIGNWSFPCRSHYFITENNVLWAREIERQSSPPQTPRSSGKQKKRQGLLSAIESLFKPK